MTQLESPKLEPPRRDREQIVTDFLRLLRDNGLYGCNASVILRRVNITSAIFKDVKSRLTSLDLIVVHEGKNTTYTITDKGVDFLRFYDNYVVVLKEIKRIK